MLQFSQFNMLKCCMLQVAILLRQFSGFIVIFYPGLKPGKIIFGWLKARILDTTVDVVL